MIFKVPWIPRYVPAPGSSDVFARAAGRHHESTWCVVRVQKPPK
jgi:hypothetical protein